MRPQKFLFLGALVAAPLACNVIIGAGDPSLKPADGTGSASSSSSAMGGGSAAGGSSAGGAAGSGPVGSGAAGGGGATTTSSTCSAGSGASGGGGADGCNPGEVCVGVEDAALIVRLSATPSSCSDGTLGSYTACDDTCFVSPPADGTCNIDVQDTHDCLNGNGEAYAGTENCGTYTASRTTLVSVVSHTGFSCAPSGSTTALHKQLCELTVASCGAQRYCVPTNACVLPKNTEDCPVDFVKQSYIAYPDSSSSCSCAATECGDVKLLLHAGKNCCGEANHRVLVPTVPTCIDIPGAFSSFDIPDSAPACTAFAKPTSSPRVACCYSPP